MKKKIVMSGADMWRKLTQPQRELLWSLAEYSHHVVSYYAPGKKLEALGLIERAGGRCQLTPEGWVALQPLLWKLPPGWMFRAHKDLNANTTQYVVEASRPALPKAQHEVRGTSFARALDALRIALGLTHEQEKRRDQW